MSKTTAPTASFQSPLEWADNFAHQAAGQPSVRCYARRWPTSYRAVATLERALRDTAVVESLGGGQIRVDVAPQADGSGEATYRFSVFSLDRRLPLGVLLPALQSFGLEVLDETPHSVVRPDGHDAYVYDFRVASPEESLDQPGATRLIEAFTACWEQRADVDGFNALTAAAALGWRDVAVLRAYGSYLQQCRYPMTGADMARTLAGHPAAVRALAEFFDTRFNPERDADRAGGALDAARAALDEVIDEVISADADRLLRAYAAAMRGTARTNRYLPDVTDGARPLALKLQPQQIRDVPVPRPRYEIFVTSPQVEGTHIRFDTIARGGLRWSDRPTDFRTEVLALARAQNVKNAVIVPAGAKGGFVVRRSPATSESGLACYRQFIGALLDVVDNLAGDGSTPTTPQGVIAYDDPDTYLVVAADKGTATFSDVANSIALQRGFWLGDAFASGGSIGYDHMKLGITAKGAWVSTRRHLREVGLDPERDPISVVGIGDMSGDVFGNGLLRSRTVRLIAAFDHRHIFLDPDPRPDEAFVERQRLFDLRRSSWSDYNPDLISPGGGVFPRSAKSIPISSQVRAALDLPDEVDSLAPDQLIRAILAAPVDLLWNGGIGTYVKASTESSADVGDRANDAIRIDATQLRARVVTEGGNLGVTPAGRIEFARLGGRINTDAHDNSAGVACSDLEVNVKILVDRAISQGLLDPAARVGLLADLTESVESLVLRQNELQNETVGLNRARAPRQLDEHRRMLARLEADHGLDRALLHLPDESRLQALQERGEGLTSPELSALAAQVRLAIRAELGEDLLDDPATTALLRAALPQQLQRLGDEVFAQHPLRRGIVGTALAGRLVDDGGLCFTFRVSNDTGASTDDVARAFLIASRIFRLDDTLGAIRALDGSTTLTDTLHVEARRAAQRACCWLLQHRPQPLDVESEVARFAGPVAALRERLPQWLRPADLDNHEMRSAWALEHGAPPALTDKVYGLLDAFCLLDVVELAAVTDTRS